MQTRSAADTLTLCFNRLSNPAIPPEVVHVVVLFAAYIPLNDRSIRQLVKRWCSRDEYSYFRYSAQHTARYGAISDWDTSKVTSMEKLFIEQENFNDDIQHWDVSSVTNMNSVFMGALSFNQPLEGWNMSNVTIMSGMFYRAEAFNQPLDGWNVTNVTNMCAVFSNASSFNQPLHNWDINSNMEDVRDMFYMTSSYKHAIPSALQVRGVRLKLNWLHKSLPIF